MGLEAALAARRQAAQDPQRIRERFMRFVKKLKNGCWRWTGAIDPEVGYGFFWLHGRQELAHRASHILFRGPLEDGRQALHSCDHRWCVAPFHLRAGSHEQNMIDAVVRGRMMRGADHVKAQLSEADVRAIRAEYRAERGELTRLSLKYGTTLQNINQIVCGKTWKHLL